MEGGLCPLWDPGPAASLSPIIAGGKRAQLGLCPRLSSRACMPLAQPSCSAAYSNCAMILIAKDLGVKLACADFIFILRNV